MKFSDIKPFTRYVDMNTGGTVHSDEEIKRVQRLIDKENSL